MKQPTSLPKPNSNQGFSAIGVVLITVVLAAVCLSGWYVWQQKHQSKSVSQPKTSQNNSTPHPDKSNDPSEGGKYLVIKEWGVRFLLPEELRGDVEYGIFTFSDGDQAAYFTSKKLAAKSPGGNCDLMPKSDSSGEGFYGGTIALSRSKAKPEEINQSSFYNSSYWYVLDFANGGVCYVGDTGQEKGTFNSLMEDAIRKLKASE